MTSKQFNLNLASNPLRNKKFFYALFFVLGAMIILVSYFAAKTFLDYRSEAKKIKAQIRKTEQLIKGAEKEEKDYSARIEEAILRNKDKVDLANNIILRKSFSWTKLLSGLESSLPDSSYIVSLAPTLTEDSRMLLQLRVASPDLSELIKFLKNLHVLQFGKIRIEGEAENERGLLIAEVSLTYERAL